MATRVRIIAVAMVVATIGVAAFAVVVVGASWALAVLQLAVGLGLVAMFTVTVGGAVLSLVRHRSGQADLDRLGDMGSRRDP